VGTVYAVLPPLDAHLAPAGGLFTLFFLAQRLAFPPRLGQQAAAALAGAISQLPPASPASSPMPRRQSMPTCSHRLPPVVFAATMSVFFFVINLSKWIPYGWLGLLDLRNMSTSLALMPFAPIGVFAGVRLAHRIQPQRFYQLIYLGMLLTGLKLVWDGFFGA
jgi:hypothetical protein